MATLASIRLITADINRLVSFYETVTESAANWATPDFAELPTTSATLAIGSTNTLAFFGPDVARAADNHTAIIEFLVPDTDADYARLGDAGAEIVSEPTTMPWGNRSLLLRDPDGNLVNLFTPTTPESVARFEAQGASS